MASTENDSCAHALRYHDVLGSTARALEGNDFPNLPTLPQLIPVLDTSLQSENDEKASGRPAVEDNHGGAITALVCSTDGQCVASGSEDGVVTLWEFHQSSLLYTRSCHTNAISSLAFSSDSGVLASASYDGTVIVWSSRSESELKRIRPRLPVYTLTYTPDGAALVMGLRDGTLEVLESKTYTTTAVLTRHAAVATFIIFSPDRSLMATGGSNAACFVWQTQRLSGGAPLSVLECAITAAAFSPDGTRIVTGSDDGTSSIWAAASGELLCVLSRHPGPVYTVAFSSDGVHVASGSAASTVRVYDSLSESEMTDESYELTRAHDGLPVNVVAFSPDGAILGSAGADNRVRLWNVPDGSAIATLEGHVDNVTLMCFAPDGSRIVSGSDDGTVRVRPVPVVADARGTAGEQHFGRC